MMTYLFIAFALVICLGLFKLARRGVRTIKGNLFQLTYPALKNAYYQTLREREQLDLGPEAAKAMFADRATLILNHYAHQVHGGMENIPFKEYTLLKKFTDQLLQKIERETPVRVKSS